MRERLLCYTVCVCVCCHYEWKIQKQWEVKGYNVGQLEMRRTSSGALFRCSLRNINSACCDASGWQGRNQLYSLSLTSVQQLQLSHDSKETVPRFAWWCICRYRLEPFQCVSILAGTYIALLRLHCVTHCCSALKDCGKEWRHVAPLLACLCGLALMSKHWMGSTGAYGTCWLVWSRWMLCMHVTSPLLPAMAWLMSSLLLVWMISPLCVNICDSTDLCRGLFLFLCRSRPSAEPACAYCCYPLYLRLPVVIGALSTSCYCDWSLW